MDNEENLPTEKVVPSDARVTFLENPKKTALAKTLKRLERNGNFNKAIEVVVGILDDEKAETKIKFEAAKFLIDTKIKLETEMARATLQRQVAEVRMLQEAQNGRKMKDVTPEDEGKPKVTFVKDVILEVGDKIL